MERWNTFGQIASSGVQLLPWGSVHHRRFGKFYYHGREESEVEGILQASQEWNALTKKASHFNSFSYRNKTMNESRIRCLSSFFDKAKSCTMPRRVEGLCSCKGPYFHTEKNR